MGKKKQKTNLLDNIADTIARRTIHECYMRGNQSLPLGVEDAMALMDNANPEAVNMRREGDSLAWRWFAHEVMIELSTSSVDYTPQAQAYVIVEVDRLLRVNGSDDFYFDPRAD